MPNRPTLTPRQARLRGAERLFATFLEKMVNPAMRLRIMTTMLAFIESFPEELFSTLTLDVSGTFLVNVYHDMNMGDIMVDENTPENILVHLLQHRLLFQDIIKRTANHHVDLSSAGQHAILQVDPCWWAAAPSLFHDAQVHLAMERRFPGLTLQVTILETLYGDTMADLFRRYRAVNTWLSGAQAVVNAILPELPVDVLA